MASVVSRQNEDENRREDGQAEGPALAVAMIAAGYMLGALLHWLGW